MRVNASTLQAVLPTHLPATDRCSHLPRRQEFTGKSRVAILPSSTPARDPRPATRMQPSLTACYTFSMGTERRVSLVCVCLCLCMCVKTTFLLHVLNPASTTAITGRDWRNHGLTSMPGILRVTDKQHTQACIGSRVETRRGEGNTHRA